MEFFESYMEHPFVQEILNDGDKIFKDKDIKLPNIVLDMDKEFNEYEYYIHNTGFSLFHLIGLFDQLKYVNNYISNYNYSIGEKNKRPTRIDHLFYNIENYYIRYTSVLDRLLQLISAVFHLCLREDTIEKHIILSNIKVSRTDVPKKYKKIEKIINKKRNTRNEIIHCHSYMELDLERLRLFYLSNLDGENERDEILKNFRSQRLKEYLKKKREEFDEMNSNLFKSVPDFFDELHKQYKEKKERLFKMIYK